MGNRTALITGASGGIGLELARIHASKGGDVVLVARSRDKLEALKREIQAQYAVKAYVLADDLADPNAADRIFHATQSLGLTIDVLINNAGFGGHGKFVERDLSADQAMMQVNMAALTSLTHFYLRGMVSRRRGHPECLVHRSVHARPPAGGVLRHQGLRHILHPGGCRRG